MTQLTNSAERETAKQDRSGARTASDVIRRIPDLDKVVISAKQIEMEGYTTINGGFKIDDDGNMECNNAKIKNADIETINGSMANPSITLKTSNTSEFAKTDLLCGIIDMYNTITSGGMELIEPQVRLYWESTGDLTTLGASGLITSGEVTSVNGICQGSSEKIKKNFEKFDNALDIIKDIDIYKYNLKSELDECKKHIGFVIGNDFKYRKEITTDDNTRVDLYSFISVCCKAIQEQQKEIEELRKLVSK